MAAKTKTETAPGPLRTPNPVASAPTIAERKAKAGDVWEVSVNPLDTSEEGKPKPVLTKKDSPREMLLDSASERINEREEGIEPEQVQLSKIAAIWGSILDKEITEKEVALMLVTLSVVELSANPDNADAWADVAGYAAVGFEVSDRPSNQRPGGW